MDWQIEYDTISKHVLTCVQEGEVTSFYLHKPGENGRMETRMMSSLIVFTGENIVITGDLSPGQYGVASSVGYGLPWFVSELSPNYLASKFLRNNVWEADRARERLGDYMKEHIKDAASARDKSELERLKKLREIMKRPWLYDSEFTWYDEVSAVIPELWDHSYFWDYPTGDFCWLAAIQKRFREAYQLYLADKEASAASQRKALIAKCPNCGRAVYAGVEIAQHMDDEGPELLGLLADGYDLVYVDVETARSLFGCECKDKTEPETAVGEAS